MILNEKHLMRLAVSIHNELKVEQAPLIRFDLPCAAWRQCEVLLRQIGRADARGWSLAAKSLRNDMRHKVQMLGNDLATAEKCLTPPQQQSHIGTIADIRDDLISIQGEFEDLSCNWEHDSISVETEPIELEGVFLGRFEIQLSWRDLAKDHSQAYRVIARDPHPAASDEDVTHPHVQGEAVCEGEGGLAIRAALQQGRLLDFFVIVANLLRTYNPGSPYVSLVNWQGVACSDCGTTVCDDERWACEKCEAAMCGECCFCCSDCDSVYCSECIGRCEECEQFTCNSCLRCCFECERDFCQSCLDESERCSECYERESEELDDDEAACGNGGDIATVQPNRLGEAAPSA